MSPTVTARFEVRFEGPFDLRATAFSGQNFRFREDPDGAVSGVVGRAHLRLRLDRPGRLEVEATGAVRPKAIRRFLSLDRDVRAITRTFRHDPVLAPLLGRAPGLRVLTQDAWETLASFLLSQNNNVKRISQMVERVADRYGEAIPGTIRRTFPPPDRLSNASTLDLRGLGLGYRAPFLHETARRITSDPACLRRIARAPFADARRTLLDLPGVGVKVAECALLYGFGFDEAFPIDVWIARALERLYPGLARGPKAGLGDACRAHFGPYAGWAQHYLFHHIRSGIIPAT